MKYELHVRILHKFIQKFWSVNNNHKHGSMSLIELKQWWLVFMSILVSILAHGIATLGFAKVLNIARMVHRRYITTVSGNFGNRAFLWSRKRNENVEIVCWILRRNCHLWLVAKFELARRSESLSISLDRFETMKVIKLMVETDGETVRSYWHGLKHSKFCFAYLVRKASWQAFRSELQWLSWDFEDSSRIKTSPQFSNCTPKAKFPQSRQPIWWPMI